MIDVLPIGERAAYIEERIAAWQRENGPYAVPTTEEMKGWIRDAMDKVADETADGGETHDRRI